MNQIIWNNKHLLSEGKSFFQPFLTTEGLSKSVTWFLRIVLSLRVAITPLFLFCFDWYRINAINLVPRAFSSFKMAAGETPGQGFQSGYKSSLEFRHANTMKCPRFVWINVSDCRKQTGPPDAGNNLRKSHFIMCHVTKYSTIRGEFQQPWPGVSPTAILIEEKDLGTRLKRHPKQMAFIN